ncbi:uncharacterized protein [Polyergus mexicanus]|uniref:uncharacterized protein n=1 Tax=Polyergus mexicanus TaxID=615972 RepID=UPI0038B50273
MVIELTGSGEKDGPTAAQRADALYADLCRVFAGKEEVRLARPVRKAELRLRGLDRSLTAAGIAAAVAGGGGCAAEEVRVGDIKFPTRGLGTAWLQCPLRAANKVAAARAIQVGWSRAQVELLDKRPLQCFRCLEKGHVQQHCSSPIDRRGCCYRCGKPGHLARDCADNVSLAERGFGLGIAAEPYYVPEANPCWIGDRAGSVAITWRNDPTLPPCTPVEAGAGVVVVRWGPISVLGVYISPSVGLAQFEAFLDEVSACFRRQMPRPIIVAGDFNAKSTRWGSRFTNARGEALQDWAAALGLCLINTGSRSTLVRWESVLDLTNDLSAAIRRAKARAWDELLRSLDADPWGRPYKLVMNKLKAWAPPATETLEPQVFDNILGTLFPSEGPPFDAGDRQDATIPWSEDLEVSEEEMAEVIRRLRLRGNKAPGPDGIPGRVWVLALAQLSRRLRRLFNSCLREGIFPPAWVRARLVLIPKGGKPSNAPSAYRPICLLDEAGKLLERVLANRLVQHLSRRDGPPPRPVWIPRGAIDR